MPKRSDIDKDIERRIRERDHLLARAQRSSRAGADHSTPAYVATDELRQLTARVTFLEAALRRFLNEDWLAANSLTALAEHARRSLAPKASAGREEQ